MRQIDRQTLRFIGAALLIAVLGACAGEEDPVSGNGFRDLPADHVVLDLSTDIKDMGALRARLHADTAYIWEDSARTLMFPVDLKLYNQNGAQTAHLTADEGELDSETNEMLARGNVVLVTVDGDRRILTEELHYDPRRELIWSDVHTVMFEGESRLEGSGFRTDADMTNIEVFESTGENIEFEL
ncbi:MAG: LPS export ABC transporter periplasmic protein LptC [Candidatus Longimicrobiales bacterium M2_2A_002]